MVERRRRSFDSCLQGLKTDCYRLLSRRSPSSNLGSLHDSGLKLVGYRASENSTSTDLPGIFKCENIDMREVAQLVEQQAKSGLSSACL